MCLLSIYYINVITPLLIKYKLLSTYNLIYPAIMLYNFKF